MSTVYSIDFRQRATRHLSELRSQPMFTGSCLGLHKWDSMPSQAPGRATEAQHQGVLPPSLRLQYIYIYYIHADIHIHELYQTYKNLSESQPALVGSLPPDEESPEVVELECGRGWPAVSPGLPASFTGAVAIVRVQGSLGLPRKPVSCHYGLLSINYGLLWGWLSRWII